MLPIILTPNMLMNTCQDTEQSRSAPGLCFWQLLMLYPSWPEYVSMQIKNYSLCSSVKNVYIYSLDISNNNSFKSQI